MASSIVHSLCVHEELRNGQGIANHAARSICATRSVHLFIGAQVDRLNPIQSDRTTMMQAELHGHAAREIVANEDYLTSTVFGHLRYLAPSTFWESFFARAVGHSGGHSLLDYLRNASVELSKADCVNVCFWPSHCQLGTPDICICFSGERVRPLVVIIEAKLEAGKSGTGKNDQLLRYLLLIRRLTELDLPLTADEVQRSAKALLFLIPHDASEEILETVQLCQKGGAKNWMPSSYNPNTKIAYLALVEACTDLQPVPGGRGRGALTSGFNFYTSVPRPDSDGNFGRVQAINLATRETLWTTRQRAPETSGVLATAGGLVFSGSFDRYLRAYDDTTGTMLWQTRLNDVLSSPPITYTAGGKQYIAIVAGRGGFQVTTHARLVPEIATPTDHTSVLWVFEVPDNAGNGH
jgi:hypothetical protein